MWILLPRGTSTCFNPRLQSSFYTAGPLVDVLVAFLSVRRPEDLRNSFSRDADRRKVASYLRGVGVNITYTNAINRRKYKITGITVSPCLLIFSLAFLSIVQACQFPQGGNRRQEYDSRKVFQANLQPHSAIPVSPMHHFWSRGKSHDSV